MGLKFFKMILFWHGNTVLPTLSWKKAIKWMCSSSTGRLEKQRNNMHIVYLYRAPLWTSLNKCHIDWLCGWLNVSCHFTCMRCPGINGAWHTRSRDTHLYRCWTNLSTSAHRRKPETAASETAHRQSQRPRVQQLQVIVGCEMLVLQLQCQNSNREVVVWH